MKQQRFLFLVVSAAVLLDVSIADRSSGLLRKNMHDDHSVVVPPTTQRFLKKKKSVKKGKGGSKSGKKLAKKDSKKDKSRKEDKKEDSPPPPPPPKDMPSPPDMMVTLPPVEEEEAPGAKNYDDLASMMLQGKCFYLDADRFAPPPIGTGGFGLSCFNMGGISAVMYQCGAVLRYCCPREEVNTELLAENCGVIERGPAVCSGQHDWGIAVLLGPGGSQAQSACCERTEGVIACPS